MNGVKKSVDSMGKEISKQGKGHYHLSSIYLGFSYSLSKLRRRAITPCCMQFSN